MNYKEETIYLRKNDPLEVFKAIRFQNNYPDRFIGHLIYIRNFFKGYDVLKGDILDERILLAIQSQFVNAHFINSELLLTDEQLATCKKITKGGDERSITFYFI